MFESDLPRSNRSVRVSGNRLKFAASHMATLGTELEPLHGHNYRELTDEGWVIDFSILKQLVREQCDALDHRFLLQMLSKTIKIEHNLDDKSYTLSHSDKRYVFPEHDVLALAIENTTAEYLAELIGMNVITKLLELELTNINKIECVVEEAPGQSGAYRQSVKQK
jgi:6-pyruvoyl-tetrahydropterin synthase